MGIPWGMAPYQMGEFTDSELQALFDSGEQKKVTTSAGITYTITRDMVIAEMKKRGLPKFPTDGSDWTNTGRQWHVMYGNGNMIMDAMMYLTFWKLWKTDPKLLAHLAETYLDDTTQIITALEESSKQNWLTAMINQQLATRILNRLGLISDDASKDILVWYDNTFNACKSAEILTATITGLTSLGGSYFGMQGKIGAAAAAE